MKFEKGHKINVGRPCTLETRKKISDGNRGKIVSEKTKIRISIANKGRLSPLKGRKLSEEQCRKMSLALKGRTSWNKGKKGAQKWSNEAREKMSLRMRGNKYAEGSPSWNKGLTKETNELIMAASLLLKNKPLSKEHRKKLSDSHKGNQQDETTKQKIAKFQRGRVRSIETRLKMREASLKRVFPKKDTSIEILLQNGLKKQGFIFEKHIPVCGICQPDIIFPNQQIAVFADGIYWHNLPGRREKDQFQNQVLEENGWIPLRFWETEINNNVEECVNKIINAIGEN